jgi:hypothetical protein
MAYSPEESAAVRAQLAAAATAQHGAQPGAGANSANRPAANADKPASSLPTGTIEYSDQAAAEARAQLVAAQRAQAALAPTEPPPSAVPAATAPLRKTTMAYSPEESAAARAQFVAAQAEARGRQVVVGAAAPQVTPASKRSSTVAYLESPIVSGGLVVMSSRDEDPSPSSPLTYRERAYFAGDHVNQAELEDLLGRELDKLREALAECGRGQFVNLAVFDHMFQGKPQRGPIATLQWKDWRGAAVFAQHTQPGSQAWASAGDEPVRSSFVPSSRSSQSLSPVSPSVQVPPAAAVPREEAWPQQPPSVSAPPDEERPSAPAPIASPAAASPRQAPSAAMYTPSPVQAANAVVSTPRGANESWPATQTKRDATGDQDRRLAVAFEAVQDLYFLSSAAEGLDFAVKLLSELVPCEAVSGSVYDINTNEFRFVAATGPGAEQRRATPVPSSTGLLSVALHSGQEAYVVADAGNDPRFDALADGREGMMPRNLVYLSLHRGDLWLGMLQMINRESPRGFSDGDIAVASYLAVQVAEFLQARRQLGGRKRG